MAGEPELSYSYWLMDGTELTIRRCGTDETGYLDGVQATKEQVKYLVKKGRRFAINWLTSFTTCFPGYVIDGVEVTQEEIRQLLRGLRTERVLFTIEPLAVTWKAEAASLAVF